MESINIRNEWLIVSGMFKWAVRKNKSIDALAKALLTSEYGYEVLSEKRHSEYADYLFMLSGFNRDFDLGTLSDDKYDYGEYVAECCGYLYKYWFDTHKEDTAEEIYRLAKPEIIYQNFVPLHVTGYDYWIAYLKDLDGRLKA